MSMPHVPGTMRNNGGSDQNIPPDLVWDEDNHPWIFPCSLHTEHRPDCPFNQQEPAEELTSESQVVLLNEGRAFARAGMSFAGVPEAYRNKIPITGIAVELVDLMMWLQMMQKLMIRHFDYTEFELEELYREEKIKFLQGIRHANEERVRKARMAAQIAVAQKPGLLGPDGRPLG